MSQRVWLNKKNVQMESYTSHIVLLIFLFIRPDLAGGVWISRMNVVAYKYIVISVKIGKQFKLCVRFYPKKLRLHKTLNHNSVEENCRSVLQLNLELVLITCSPMH